LIDDPIEPAIFLSVAGKDRSRSFVIERLRIGFELGLGLNAMIDSFNDCDVCGNKWNSVTTVTHTSVLLLLT
jgi:hypothetical protein